MVTTKDAPDHDADLRSSIKEALKRPIALTRNEQVAFITRRFYFGAPQVRQKPPGTRGPRYRRNQYDEAYARRAELYRRLVKLPALRVGAGPFAGPAFRRKVIRLGGWLLEENEPPENLTMAVIEHLALEAKDRNAKNYRAPSVRVVQRILQKKPAR